MTKNTVYLACLLAALLGGCGKDPEKLKREYLASGERYLAEKKQSEAIIQFRNAIQQDPRFGEARLALGNVLLENGDLRGAYSELVRAADLMPTRADVQLKAAELNLQAGRFDDAKARADRVLATDPKNITALVMKGAALAGNRQLDDAVKQIESAIQLDPNRSSTYANLGVLQMVKGKPEDAEKLFVQAVTLDPKSSPARLALANFYWSRGQRDKVESTLKDALAVIPQDLQVNRLLAYLYLTTERDAEAEPYLKTIAARSQDPAARAALADYYRRANRMPEAMKILDALAADPKGFSIANVRKATIYFADGEKQLAYSTLDNVLEKDGKDLGALLAKSQFLINDRKLDDAVKLAQRAVDADPRIVTSQMVLARSLAARGDADAAIGRYTEALKLSPKLVAAQLELARLHLSRRRVQDALRYAREAQALAPNNPEMLLVLARTQMAAGDIAAAETGMKALAAQYENAPALQAQLGTLYLLKKDRGAARRAFERALQGDTANQEALSGLLLMDVEDKRAAIALARIKGLAESRPKDAALQVIAARTYIANGDAAAAERLLRQAIDAEPTSMSAYTLLIGLYVSQRRTDDALGQLQRVVDRDPKSVSALTAMGLLLEATNRAKEAQARYQQVLAIDPTAPVAANNLAWMYAERGEQMDVALQLAQGAKSRLPDSPYVADTLGWIYYKKGLYSQAVTELQMSAEKEPNTAVFQYHLGQAHVKTGELRQARQALESGLRLDPKSSEAASARAALEQLSVLGS